MTMSRNHGSNFAPKGWQEYWAHRLIGALCRPRPDLPWTGRENPETGKEEPPSRAELAAMRDLCNSCPVMITCADYALDKHLPAQGGMYATVWIPWQPANGATAPSNRTKGWLDARAKLRWLRAYWTEQTLQGIFAMAPREPVRPRNARTRVASRKVV